MPGETDHPPPLDLPDDARNVIVYLAVPISPARRDRNDAAGRTGDVAAGRYAIRDFEAYDTHSGSPQPADLLIGRLRLRYMLETEDRGGLFLYWPGPGDRGHIGPARDAG